MYITNRELCQVPVGSYVQKWLNLTVFNSIAKSIHQSHIKPHVMFGGQSHPQNSFMSNK